VIATTTPHDEGKIQEGDVTHRRRVMIGRLWGNLMIGVNWQIGDWGLINLPQLFFIERDPSYKVQPRINKTMG
jgi:hypothetical protein